MVFTLEVAVACMSRFVDQFVLLFDASKPPPILVTVRTDTKHSACATLHFVLGGVFVRYSSRSQRKTKAEKQHSHSSALPFCSLSVSAAGGLVAVPPPPVRRAHAPGSLKPLLSDGQTHTHTHTTPSLAPAAALRRLYALGSCPPRPRVMSGRRCHAAAVAWSPGLDRANAFG